MFYRKKGLPEEGDIVLCTVKKILYHSIFAELDEYEHQDGMIHISEIAPGRIRNIRDYVREGKKLVVQVLRVDTVKRQVDLSLRRVPMNLRNKKNEEYRQESKSEKLLELVGKELGTDLAGAYKKFGYKLLEQYGLLQNAFNDISVHGMEAVAELKLPDKEAKTLVTIIQDKIRPPEVSVSCELVLQSVQENGVEDIKHALVVGEEFANKNDVKMTLTYVSAPKYRVEVFSNDYIDAEDKLESVTKLILAEMKKAKGTGERIKKK